MIRKKALHDKVISLREKGLSYNEILGVVSIGNGTISRWCSAIELTEKQKDRIKDKKRNTPLIRNSIKSSMENKGRDKAWAEKVMSEVKLGGNELLLSGIMLYWAEGFNSSKSQNAVFTNTDSEMVKLALRFFREVLLVDNSKVKVMVRIGEKGDVAMAEKYWAKVTGLSMDRFQKPEILKLKENSKSLEKYPNGICRISVYDVTVRRKISNCIELIKSKISPRSSMDRA